MKKIREMLTAYGFRHKAAYPQGVSITIHDNETGIVFCFGTDDVIFEFYNNRDFLKKITQ